MSVWKIDLYSHHCFLKLSCLWAYHTLMIPFNNVCVKNWFIQSSLLFKIVLFVGQVQCLLIKFWFFLKSLLTIKYSSIIQLTWQLFEWVMEKSEGCDDFRTLERPAIGRRIYFADHMWEYVLKTISLSKQFVVEIFKEEVFSLTFWTFVHMQEQEFDCTGKRGYFGHPSTPSVYYFCEQGGTAKKYECPDNLAFNFQIGSCDWPERLLGNEGSFVSRDIPLNVLHGGQSRESVIGV